MQEHKQLEPTSDMHVVAQVLHMQKLDSFVQQKTNGTTVPVKLSVAHPEQIKAAAKTAKMEKRLLVSAATIPLAAVPVTLWETTWGLVPLCASFIAVMFYGTANDVASEGSPRQWRLPPVVADAHRRVSEIAADDRWEEDPQQCANFQLAAEVCEELCLAIAQNIEEGLLDLDETSAMCSEVLRIASQIETTVMQYNQLQEKPVNEPLQKAQALHILPERHDK